MSQQPSHQDIQDHLTRHAMLEHLHRQAAKVLPPPQPPPLDLSPLFNNLDQPRPSHLGSLGLPPLHLLSPDGVQAFLGSTSATGRAAA